MSNENPTENSREVFDENEAGIAQKKQEITDAVATGDYGKVAELAQEAKAMETAKAEMIGNDEDEAIETNKGIDEAKAAEEKAGREAALAEAAKQDDENSQKEAAALLEKMKSGDAGNDAESNERVNMKELADSALKDSFINAQYNHDPNSVPDTVKEIYRDTYISNFKSTGHRIAIGQASLEDVMEESRRLADERTLDFIYDIKASKNGFDLSYTSLPEAGTFNRFMNKSNTEIVADLKIDADIMKEVIDESQKTLSKLKSDISARLRGTGEMASEQYANGINNTIAEIDRQLGELDKIKGNGAENAVDVQKETAEGKPIDPVEINNRIVNMRSEKEKTEALANLSKEEIEAVAKNIAESDWEHILDFLGNFRNKPEIIAQPEITEKFKEMLSSGRVHIYNVERIYNLPGTAEVFADPSVRKGLIESSISSMKNLRQGDAEAMLPIIEKIGLSPAELRSVAEELKGSDSFNRFVQHFGVRNIYPEVV